MRNTSWLVPGVLMASSTPKRPEHIHALAALGIGLVITLTEEEPLPPAWFQGGPARAGCGAVFNLFIPVRNYEPPSEGQMDSLLAAIETHWHSQHGGHGAGGGGRGRGVLVHCGGGKGRAGTALACYLCNQQPCVRDDSGWAPQPPAMAAKVAVRLLREMRPGSIETDQQERFVGTYSKTLWWRHQQTAVGVDEEEGRAEGAGTAVEPQAMHRPQSPTNAAAAAAVAVTAAGSAAASAADSSRQRAECSGSNATPASDDRRPGLPAGGYPSTPHLPSSPQVAADDTQLDAAGCSDLLNVEVVVTEKLDGGNCCIHQGAVYARTHKHPATHPSFGPIKVLAAAQLADVPPHHALFGENMSAVHSIAYRELPARFFLFAIWDTSTQVWLSWDDVEGWAQRLGLHTAPVVARGVFRSLEELAASLSASMAEPSAADSTGATPKEGFVVRTAAAIPGALFPRSVAKYVRAGHVQTDGTWRRTWKAARVVQRQPASASIGALAEPETREGALADGASTTSQEQHQQPDAAGPLVASGPAAAAPTQATSRGHGRGRRGARKGIRGVGGSGGARPGGGVIRLPRLIMLVGLPGSGKSTFARALAAAGGWSHVCQDDCGGRAAAESAFGIAMLRGPDVGRHVILDRCNATAADRRRWLDLGLIGKRDKGVVAVFFDVAADACKRRVAARTDHPTIPQGRGARAVDSFAEQLQPPSTQEGFERVHVIRNESEANALLASLGAGPLGLQP
ncbi:hypothetical protein MNEG_12607 [Monoraphidium neglectum]|uniref:Tyrosine specific protein phosphatases domain-containing protein n=1 Tax=Monoraphidium neglectum TaxID=145388 RepID=A0A0D2MKB3_9CHLO|nr:hypothetical protein MNEG_12607 [Monoraphidium neglectum]KIY95355.1 hypothetical protein MNEG_12607 [Monoraphidium neglectum]|eukprot:XP_013894375.1 hypothetical protein MNEG_12607 [Monoraphidium neglectum]